MKSKQAYKIWRATHKVDMQVRTDEQMFEIGYNWRNDEVKDLEELVIALSDKLEETKNDKRKTKEDNGAIPQQLGSDLPKKKKVK